MYVVNPSTLSKTITVSKRLGEYILKHNEICVLSKQGENYIFSETPEFKQIIANISWYIKWLYK